MEKIFKVAIIGPESTGKSVMSKYLAEYYHTLWVPEYARAYCELLTEPCTLQDEINMFYGQIGLEDTYLNQLQAPYIFCDTTILNVKVWCDHVFHQTPAFVLDEIYARPYDLYLLMDIDLPWEDDPLREFKDKRSYFFELFKKELRDLRANFEIVSGIQNDRFNRALEIINTYLTH